MLSHRLQNVVDMVSKNSIVADIGTDHGYVPIYLIENNISPFVYGVDINDGPLEIAKKNVEQKGFLKKIELIKGDGLTPLVDKKIDTITISGMGGELIVDILKKYPINTVKELILSPQKGQDSVREYILNKGFEIVEERMFMDMGKRYVIIKAIKGKEDKYSNFELKYGRCLLNTKNKCLEEYLDYEKNKLEKIIEKMKENNSDNIEDIEILLEINRKAREKYD